jgi:hypothetical protein
VEEAATWELLDAADRPICPNCLTNADKTKIAELEAHELEEWKVFRDREARRTERLTDEELRREFGEQEDDDAS